MTRGPTEYPSDWSGARPSASPAAPAEAVALAVDAFVASVSNEEFDAMVARCRGGR